MAKKVTRIGVLILEYLEKHPGVSYKDLTQNTELGSHAQIERCIKYLRSSGFIMVKKKKLKNESAYFIAPGRGNNSFQPPSTLTEDSFQPPSTLGGNSFQSPHFLGVSHPQFDSIQRNTYKSLNHNILIHKNHKYVKEFLWSELKDNHALSEWAKTDLAEIFETLDPEKAQALYQIIRARLIPFLGLPIKRTPVPETSVLKLPAPKVTLRPPSGIETKKVASISEKLPVRKKAELKASLTVEQQKAQKLRAAEISAIQQRAAQNCYVAYYGMNEDKRSLQYAYAYVELCDRFAPGKTKNYIDLTKTLKFREHKYAPYIRRAHRFCDEMGLKYEEYLKALFQHYYVHADDYKFTYPTINALTGENAQNIWEDYQSTVLKSCFVIQRSDLEKPNLPWLLPENFPDPDPEVLKKQCAIIHDKIFIEIERVAFNTTRLYEALDDAIRKQIIPQTWAEGFGKYHHIEKLKHYAYTPPKSAFKGLKLKTA